jgi:hypothetical protein
MATVDPDAKTADSRAAARIVPTAPRRGSRRAAGGRSGEGAFPPNAGGVEGVGGDGRVEEMEPQLVTGSAGRCQGEVAGVSVGVGSSSRNIPSILRSRRFGDVDASQALASEIVLRDEGTRT